MYFYHMRKSCTKGDEVMDKKVFVGMSGGVDSSVTAALLKQSGYSVAGINLLLTPDDTGEATADAKAVAEALDIPLHIVDLRKEFDENVIRYFVDEYLKGRTPNPCVKCNETIKFGLLLKRALKLGADCIATGHYAKIGCTDGVYSLERADSSKDQSYFLSRLNQHQLAHSMFPICSFEKQDTRKIAEEMGLPVAAKKDSQEICFVKDKDYVKFIKDYAGVMPEPGNFVDVDGNILGKHLGIINYTIGQRKGLGMAFGEPMFVTGIDVAKNEILLAPQGKQLSEGCEVTDVRYIDPSFAPVGEFEANVKIRCRAIPAPARVLPCEDGAKIVFYEPQRAVTPGQLAVFYDGDTVIGSGYIK